MGNSKERELEDILKSLWDNWAFRLSLSSNELFHSNVLQYLAEELSQNPEGTGDELDDPESITKDAAIRLLEILGHEDQELIKPTCEKLKNGNEYVFVKREWNHMDLVILERIKNEDGIIKIGRPLFAVEVKVKDYPAADQLGGYREVLEQKWGGKNCNYRPPLFLLAGNGGDVIGSDNYLNDSPTSWIGFTLLGNLLNTERNKGAIRTPVLEQYIKLCRSLGDLFEKLNEKLNEKLTWHDAMEIGNMLHRYRLHSLWWKLWAAYVRTTFDTHVRKKFKQNRNNIGTYFFCRSGFSRTGLVEAFWSQPSLVNQAKGSTNPNGTIRIGVQIEGDSFRLYLNVLSKGLGNGLEARKKADAALVKLIYSLGVFAANPGMSKLEARWHDFGGDETTLQSDYKPWLRSENIQQDSTTHPGDIARGPQYFTNDAPGKGSKVGGITPMLTGYANGQDNGFADIRLGLCGKITIGEVTELVCEILVENKFSKSSGTDAHLPLLFRVVKGFESATNKGAWLDNPQISNQYLHQ